MLADDGFVDFWCPKDSRSHWCFNRCGRHRVDPNPVPSGFQCCGLGQPDYAMFAGGICCCAGRSDLAENRCHVHYSPATTLLKHLTNFELKGEPDTLEVDVDGAIPILFGLSDDRYPNAFNPGVIEGDVQATEFLRRFLDERLNFRRFRHIGLYKQAIATGSTD